MVEELAASVTRPAVYAASVDVVERHMIAGSQLGEDGAAEPIDPSAPEPVDAILAAETCELAMKPLAGADRHIMRLLIEGRRPTDIAAAVGLSKQTFFRRLTAIRWASRARADLAAHLGVPPGPPPPARVDGHYPCFKPDPMRLAV